jgi:hypothetical protein
MAFDPLSMTAEAALLADVAAPAVASEAIIPSILTGIGGIGATDAAAIAAAEAGALPMVGGQLAANVPSILGGIGGIGAGDTAALASALGGAAPGTVGSTLASSGLSDLASLAPGAIDPATGQLVNAATANATNAGISLNNVPPGIDPQTGLPSAQFDFNAANAAPGQGINIGTGMPGGTPGAPGVNISPDAIGKSVIDQVPGNPAFDITSPSIGKFGQGAADAQGILGKMGLGGLEDFYNKNKLLSSVALSAGMGALGSKQPGVAPIKKYDGKLNKYHLADNFQSTEPTQGIFKPSYADGGIVGLASGGTYDPTSYKGPRWGSANNSSSNNSYDGPRSFMASRVKDVISKHGKTTTPTPTPTPTPTTPTPDIYRSAYTTQPQTNVPVLAAQADPGLWNESMYSPMFAEGGIASYGLGGEVNTTYPQAHQDTTQFANQNQLPTAARNMQYEPKTDPMTGQMIGFAEGGMARYAYGNLVEPKEPKLSNIAAEYYSLHSKAKEALPHADVGIFHDSDPDTQHLDPQQAAMMRLKKQFAYAQMAQPKTNLKPMAALGTLPVAQQQAVQAASGGIMGYNLGGYATGGNSRLLKGPGDGMSDNIPATIADRQPARLADGEFVVPADVVSHLGNGSTDAGAKKLHGMMDKVRVARTGKKKQGTQINPNKFLPA